MSRTALKNRYGFLSALGISAFVIGSVWAYPKLAPESSPVARGESYALSKGCTRCHNKSEISQLCESGLQETIVHGHGDHPVNDGICNDILTYFSAEKLSQNLSERALVAPNNRLLKGELLARQQHCFICHGYLGQGGFPNDNALKGYVPGFFGKDFKALTGGGNRESVRSWISMGEDPDLFEHPITGRLARYFIDRQEVKMPIFDTLSTDDLSLLVDYVMAIHAYGPMDRVNILAYEQKTVENEVGSAQ